MTVRPNMKKVVDSTIGVFAPTLNSKSDSSVGSTLPVYLLMIVAEVVFS
ncbi:hypothetical protein [Wolbachia endosymbiont of Dirofilaria (Dirofilaria) immitis]|nr:hypothetical protein [Wolbachia endosymbiont of Dirofilaria (Dirofilaria) immitis]QKX02374.1 hypothetical protein GOY12_02255 [Wolbachia endosymbiont of Dirofilaria (Dirofilaria) immitis]